MSTFIRAVGICAVFFAFVVSMFGRAADQRPAVGPDELPPSYMGQVTAVSGETIVIKPKGNHKITATLSLGGGKVEQLADYVQDNSKPPHSFVFSNELLYYNGTLPATRFPKRGLGLTPQGGLHKISDVQIGDIVWITCRRDQGTDTCIEIQILRRPGGKVPPAFDDEKRDAKSRIDNGRNAEQFIEEKVVPKLIPRLFVRFHP